MALNRWAVAAVVAVGMAGSAFAHDLKLTIPERGKLTPIQRLNRDGVEQVRKHNYERAETLFYKAYLLDPDNPFTLNNLGYIAELQGQVNRAERFYQLAAKLPTDAVIDIASNKNLLGKEVEAALQHPELPMQIDHDNVEAVRLLAQGRAPEADLLLTQTLKSDPRNIYTLNNLGVAKEMEGESQDALRYYDEAAAGPSDVTAVVTVNRFWRGKPISQMASQNGKLLRARLAKENTVDARVAELNLRGVSAINRNDPETANKDFREAYALDPNNAFARNNIGYVAELEGDRETAQFFYNSAQAGMGSIQKVRFASSRNGEGERLGSLAADNASKVQSRLAASQQELRQANPPIVLRRRDGSIVQEPAIAPAPTAPNQQPQ